MLVNTKNKKHNKVHPKTKERFCALLNLRNAQWRLKNERCHIGRFNINCYFYLIKIYYITNCIVIRCKSIN